MATRLEINFNRLLNRCESIASEKRTDWRLEKYVSSLQEKLGELKKSPSRPTQEELIEYARKVEFLRGLIEAEKLPTASARALAAERLAPGLTSSNSHGPSASLHLQTKARYQKDIRDELLGIDNNKSTENGIRHRKPASEETEDIDSLLQHHHQMQEKLAEEMLMLTRNLKQNATVSNQIVLEDNKRLDETKTLADSNLSRLKVESGRLEVHTRSCSWWVWIMLAVVSLTFLWMIVFMKMFKKK